MAVDFKPKDSSSKISSSAPSFIKLAMKNMVRKGSQSLFHFALTTFGFLIFIIVVAYLGRPSLPS